MFLLALCKHSKPAFCRRVVLPHQKFRLGLELGEWGGGLFLDIRISGAVFRLSAVLRVLDDSR